MNALDADKSDSITYDEFFRAHRKVSSLMFPAFTMQKKLRVRGSGGGGGRASERDGAPRSRGTGRVAWRWMA